MSVVQQLMGDLTVPSDARMGPRVRAEQAAAGAAFTVLGLPLIQEAP